MRAGPTAVSLATANPLRCPRTHSGRHDLKDTTILDEANRVVTQPCKACRELIVVGCLCMIGRAEGVDGYCSGYPTKRVPALGNVYLCRDHLLALGATYGGFDTTAAGHGVRLSDRQRRAGY